MQSNTAPTLMTEVPAIDTFFFFFFLLGSTFLLREGNIYPFLTFPVLKVINLLKTFSLISRPYTSIMLSFLQYIMLAKVFSGLPFDVGITDFLDTKIKVA